MSMVFGIKMPRYPLLRLVPDPSLTFKQKAKKHYWKYVKMLRPSQAPAGSLEQQVGDLFASIMDTNTIEAKGYSPLQQVFDQIDRLSNSQELISFVNAQRINGNGLLFGFGVGADDKNASMNIAQFFQGGIGLRQGLLF